ncbi:hypothetical protein [Flavobacterium cerinum]|uniref:Uncharacterized protein n=1 Tax=Flavobacterium cerinum TaxID=2502784 RepID=A0ABY5IV89_9FLAO|nr:hypothetical protein [Flavobacterium cerinum]UUC46752.1 hypothetical protein NOX80_06010 [Flavobacterium cerinum]
MTVGGEKGGKGVISYVKIVSCILEWNFCAAAFRFSNRFYIMQSLPEL